MDGSTRGLRVALLAGAVVLASAVPGLAQRDDPGLQTNCAGDYFRLCAGMNPDGPEVEACFDRNKARLSAGCRAAINRYDRGHGAAPEGDEDSDSAAATPRRR